MPKVLIRSIKQPGKTARVDSRLVERYAKRGWVLADAPAPAPRDLAELTFNELRALAKERGLELGRASKAEIVAALNVHARGSYRRRDLRAEP